MLIFLLRLNQKISYVVHNTGTGAVMTGADVNYIEDINALVPPNRICFQ